MIEYQDWGLVEYNEAWAKQESLFSASIEKKMQGLPTDNYLVFCEHPHVYTLGKSGDEQNMLLNMIQLQAKHATFVHSNRGGDITGTAYTDGTYLAAGRCSCIEPHTR